MITKGGGGRLLKRQRQPAMANLLPVDTAHERPDRVERMAATRVPVIAKVPPPTPEQIHDAQLVVAGFAYRQGWQLWELTQVLGSLGIDPRETGGPS